MLPPVVVAALARAGRPMRVSFTRTGGVSGIPRTTVIDTESLGEEEALEMTELVNAAGFFDLPSTPQGSAPGTDRFSYRLTVEDGSRQHTVDVGESPDSEALAALMERLNALSRPKHRSRG